MKDLLKLRNFYSEQIAFGDDVFDRIALFIYGLNYEKAKNIKMYHYRKDGVIKGADFSLTNRKIPPESDDDSKRIAIFYNEDSPYNLDESGNLHINNYYTHSNLKPFIYKKYKFDDYLYYLRSNRKNVYNRLVVNPHRNCNSMCKWCARTYSDHKRIYNKLKRKDLSVLDDKIEIKAIRKIPLEIIPTQKLFECLINDNNIISNRGMPFSHLEELAFISGDFPPKTSIASYIYEFTMSMKNHGFNGSIYYAGHQIENEKDMQLIKNIGLNVTFVYTIEHFTRRTELMPVKGKRTLNEIADILYTANRIFGKNNVFYYYIAGIDDFESVYDNFIRFKPLAKPLVSILTPYNTKQFELYFYKDKLKIIKQMFDIRDLILKLWGKPIPSGSNRSLFALNANSNIIAE